MVKNISNIDTDEEIVAQCILYSEEINSDVPARVFLVDKVSASDRDIYLDILSEFPIFLV